MSAAGGVVVECSRKPSVLCVHYTYRGLRSKAPKRKRCGYCGAPMRVEGRVWACVEWREDGRYERPDVTYPTPEKAVAAADRDDLVLRSWSAT